MPAPMSGQEAADFWIQKGNYPKALLALRPLITESPNNANLFYQIGFCLAKVGEYEEAHQQLHRALSIDPNHAEAKKLLDRVDYPPDDEGPRSISADIFDEQIATIKALKRIECPRCGGKLLKGVKDCSHCGYLFPHFKLVKNIAAVIIVIAFLAGGRYYFLGEEAFGWPAITLHGLAVFTVGLLQTMTNLLAAAFVVNWVEADKAWNHEWKLDLGASAFTALCMVFVNLWVLFLTNQISTIPGWGLFLIGVWLFKLFVTLFLVYFFFQRRFIYFILLVLTYYCTSPLFYILFTPLRELASLI